MYTHNVHEHKYTSECAIHCPIRLFLILWWKLNSFSVQNKRLWPFWCEVVHILCITYCYIVITGRVEIVLRMSIKKLQQLLLNCYKIRVFAMFHTYRWNTTCIYRGVIAFILQIMYFFLLIIQDIDNFIFQYCIIILAPLKKRFICKCVYMSIVDTLTPCGVSSFLLNRLALMLEERTGSDYLVQYPICRIYSHS